MHIYINIYTRYSVQATYPSQSTCYTHTQPKHRKPIWKRSRSHPPITAGLYLPGWVYAPWHMVAEAAYGQE